MVVGGSHGVLGEFLEAPDHVDFSRFDGDCGYIVTASGVQLVEFFANNSVPEFAKRKLGASNHPEDESDDDFGEWRSGIVWTHTG